MLMGHNFRESNSNSTVMIVVEGQKKLGDDVTATTIASFINWSRILHIQYIQYLWGGIRSRRPGPECRRQGRLRDVESGR